MIIWTDHLSGLINWTDHLAGLNHAPSSPFVPCALPGSLGEGGSAHHPAAAVAMSPVAAVAPEGLPPPSAAACLSEAALPPCRGPASHVTHDQNLLRPGSTAGIQPTLRKVGTTVTYRDLPNERVCLAAGGGFTLL